MGTIGTIRTIGTIGTIGTIRRDAGTLARFLFPPEAVVCMV